MDWNDLRHFLALARTGSVRAAGTSLRVSHSTILRRVEALEEQLGARLFDRSRSGFTLTDIGEDMLPVAERIEHEFSSLERGVAGRDDQLEGPITITCGDDWVADFILSALREFCEQFPGIHLHLGIDGRQFDLSRREADLAIRALPVSGQPPEPLIATRLTDVLLGTYVAVAHAHRLDPDRPGNHARWAAVEDSATQKSLAATTSYDHLEHWGGFSSLAVLISALEHGYGIGMLPTYIGDHEPTLQRVRKPGLAHLGNLWLLSHPDLRTNARLRACRRVILEAFETNSAWFDGTGPLAHPPVTDPGVVPVLEPS